MSPVDLLSTVSIGREVHDVSFVSISGSRDACADFHVRSEVSVVVQMSVSALQLRYAVRLVNPSKGLDEACDL